MKKKTTVVLIVVASCVVVFGFFALMVAVAFLGDGGFEFSGFGPRVAVIEIYGEITDSRDVVRQLKKWTDDDGVKAIVLDINSPGGAVAPSQEMYEQVLKAREDGKIVVAAFRSVAASGGYYIACAADKIVSNPGSLTGSIGVIMQFPTAQKLFDKIGIRWETIKSGELKDVGNMARPMSEEEERMLKAVIDDTYEQFVEAVSEGRDMSIETIYRYADGSIFTGRQAYNLGLVDTLGTYEDAIAIAGEMADLGSTPDVVKEKKKQQSFFDTLYGALNTVEKISLLEQQQPSLMYLYR